MPSAAATPLLRRLWPLRPWPVVFAGLAVTALGTAVFWVCDALSVGDPLAPVRFALFLIGLVAVGVGVSMRLKTASQAFEERLNTAAMLAVAAFAGLAAFLGTEPAWDSLQMLLVAMIAVALLGVVLVMLPTPARMLVVMSRNTKHATRISPLYASSTGGALNARM